jgi:ankyrin repeat protein
MPKSAAHLALPPPHRPSLGPARPYLDDGGDTNLDNNDDAAAVAVQAAQAEEAQAQAEAAGERLKGIVRIRGGGCAASKPRAQAEPFIQDLEGPSESSSPLAVEPGPEAVPEDMNVAEPGPETIHTMPTEVVEPAAGAAMEAEAALAEAAAETKNPIVEIGNSIIDAIVLAFTPRAGLFSSGPSNGPTQPNALDDGDDTNLDDIDDDDDDAVRPTKAMGAPPEIIRVLSGLDDRLADALRAGDIKLLSVSWLRRLRRLLRKPNKRRLKRRQELEALFLASGKKSPFLSAEEAVALLRRGNRGVGALTHGWLSPGECDPNGARLDMVLAAIEEHPQIEGIFWDYASLFQNLPDRDRTPDESAAFKRAIMVMADVYASAVGTTVLQSREIPPRPEAFDGALCLFGLKATKGEAAVRETLGCFGAIDAFEHTRNPPVVRFASHEAALAAKRAGPWPELCDGIDTLYNERPYDERGWCVFEDAVSHELLARLGAVPRVREALDALPSKVLVLRSGRPTEPCVAPIGELADRVERVVARIAGATFTGKGDKVTVPALYREYVTRIVGVVQPVLALAAKAAAGSQVVLVLPPMPVDTGFASIRAWHLDCLRAQHAYIPDALSGQQLSTLTECVPIGVEGHDADGKPLAVRDARSLCAWLHDLRSSARTCALLTAGPAAGKTWLMSQLIMHALGQGDGRAEDDGRAPLVPVLVRAEQLQKRLAEQGAAFDAANDWVDADLKLTCAPPHYAMLRAAMQERHVLLLLDGLDEAGAQWARIEKHVAEVLAPKGFVILCTSRPSGLDEACFAGFHRLTLAPLTDAQQEAFLATRLGDERASALKSYLRDKVPLDAGGEAGTRRRVTANPLMLSMVCSIAQLRVGIDMPTTTAELYEVAAGAMLKQRSGAAVSDDARALLQATFFEAHAAEQRIITEAHLGAAAARIGARIGNAAAQRAADELCALVARDGLPLVRLLEAKPLQMQAFHLSFQEYYAMLAIGDGGVPLPSFVWGVWWTNAVLMGVQAGGAAFGDAFVKAAQLPVAEAAAVPAKEAWRLRVLATLVRKGLPAAWLPTALEAAKGVAREAAREAGKLAVADALVVGKRVLALFVIWKPAVVTRVEGDAVDVKIQGWHEKNTMVKGLPRTKALVVASDGAGALLRLAAGAGDAALVEALLDAGVNPLVADERANTPLHRAAAGGHVAICRALVAKGADKEERNTQFQSAADAARNAKQHAVVRLFEPTLSDREFTDETCMCTERLRAAATGDLATLARTQDAGRITALMVASRRKQLAAVAKLLESSNASTLNALSAKGCTALYLAAEEGAEPIVQQLLTRGADAALADSDGGTPLMLASRFGHERCLHVLLEAMADPNMAKSNGMTALMFAAQNCHVQVALVLLEAKADPNMARSNGWTALMLAAENGHEQVALVLLETKADPNKAKSDGFTALMCATQNGHEQVALVLLEAKADPNRATSNGETALMCAAENGHEQVAHVLLEAKADPNMAKSNGSTALMLAALNGHEQVALILLEAKADPNMATSDGWTALMCAARNGHEQVALVLLEAKADPNQAMPDGRTALILAAENGHEQVALVLLEAKADPNMAQPDGLTALMCAAQNGHEQVALVLLEAKADPNMANNNGWTALMSAAQDGHEQVALVLLEAKADTYKATSDGWTALMLAAEVGHEQVALVLLETKADPNQAMPDGRTALILAAEIGHEQVALILLEAKADPNRAMSNGLTALMCAAQNGHEQVALVLLEAKADPNMANNNGWTALMSAAQDGHEQVTLVLLEAKADPNQAMPDGLTALMHTAEIGHEQVALVLLEAKADPNQAMPDGRTALMLAAEIGHEQVALVLLEAKADPNMAQPDGLTALMCAAQNGHEQVALVLLEAKADPNQAKKPAEPP